jgi:hypothetical protein
MHLLKAHEQSSSIRFSKKSAALSNRENLLTENIQLCMESLPPVVGRIWQELQLRQRHSLCQISLLLQHQQTIGAGKSWILYDRYC